MPLEPARACAKRGDGQPRRVVDVERQRLEVGGGAGQLAELLLADLAHAQIFAADPRFLGKDAGGELIGRHFQAEDRNWRTGRLGGIDPVFLVAGEALRGREGHVGGERGFAHAWTTGEDQQVGAMKPADLAVDPVEAGRHPAEMPARVQRALGLLDRQLGRFAEALDLALAPALFGDAVEFALGAFDLGERRHLFRRIECALDHVAPDRDQRAEQGEIINLLGEIAGADDRRARSGQLGEIGRATDLAHCVVGLEHRAKCNRVGDHILVGHAEDGVVDAAVQRLEIMVRAKLQLNVLNQPVVDHQRAEQRCLRLDIMRERGGDGRVGGIVESEDFGHPPILWEDASPLQPPARYLRGRSCG